MDNMKNIHSPQQIFDLFRQHRHICTDTRKIVPGAIFFALKGENHDANAFAREAIEKGCACAVIDNPQYAGERCFLVENCLETLQKIAVLYRESLMIPVIGVTGTNGKTTTKELLRSVLSTRFKTYATQGNLNNHIGVPLSILSIPSDTEMAIIEMGANHPGEIAELCKIALPTYGLITNIGKGHLEGFGSFENIVHTKTALYDFLRKVKGKAFVCADNPLLMELSQGLERFCYGEKNDVFLQMTPLENGKPCLECCLHGSVSSPALSEISTQLIGAYNLENVAGAACAGRYFGLSDHEIVAGIAAYTPTNLRSQSIRIGNNLLIADTYNANPTSMAAAINNFGKMQLAQTKTVILGDMLELGDASQEEHQQVIELLKQHNIPQAYLIGGCFGKTEHPSEYRRFAKTEDLLAYLETHPLENRSVLLKGSHGIHLEKVIDFLQQAKR